MKKLFSLLRRIPWWGYAAGVFYFVLQRVLYGLGAKLCVSFGMIEKAFEWKIPVIDDLFPLIPVFALPYLYCFVFWLMGPMAVSLTGKTNRKRFFYGFTLAYLIGFVFFIFVPTFMDRGKEGLLAVAEQPGLFHSLLHFIYKNDGWTVAYNLFPSYHCLISTYCYLGVRKQPEISKGYRVYSLIMAILTCLSTLFTKQHYLPDVIGGVLIALGCYVLMEKRIGDDCQTG